MPIAKADLYREYAQLCRERAKAGTNPAGCRFFLYLAEAWNDLAGISNRLDRDRRDHDACRRRMHAPADSG